MGEPILFVVRVWRMPEGFRAAVRQVDSERVEVFACGADLAHFLESGRLPASSTLAESSTKESP